VVKTLSAPTSSSGVYLCLPRALPSSFEPSDEVDSDLYDRVSETHDAFQTVSGNARLQQQLPLLSYKNLNDVLYKSMQQNGASALPDQHLRMLPQLVVVKTRRKTDELRNEALHIEEQHRKGECATLHIGSYVLGAQYTTSPSTSFICLRPVFGPTLAQFGEASNKDGQSGIPGWFVAHICIGLVDAVGFLHDEGMVHGKIEASNIMLNLYATYMHHRYRGYPDVQLIDFSATGPGDEDAVEEDSRGILEVMEQTIAKWSDVAPFIGFADNATGSGREGEDPLVAQLAFIEMMLAGDYDEYFNIPDLRERAEDMRHEGPEMMPKTLIKLLHEDLVPATEIERAVQDPLVLKVRNHREALGKVLEDVPVTMAGKGHAGMKTERIIVMRFVRRKLEFLDAIGEYVAEESTDDETRGIGDRDAELADDEMSGA
jgi:serine/threonine protein kinase